MAIILNGRNIGKVLHNSRVVYDSQQSATPPSTGEIGEIKKVEYFTQCWPYPWSIYSTYAGTGLYKFLDKDGWPYVPIAYSWNIDGVTKPTSFVFSNYTRPQDIYFTPWHGVDTPHFDGECNKLRAITTPPTDEDLEFLAQFPRILKVTGYVPNNFMLTNGNYYDWCMPLYSFRWVPEYSLPIAKTQKTYGAIGASQTCLRFSFWIDDPASLQEYFTYVKGIQFFLHGHSATNGTYLYSPTCFLIQRHYNDFLDFNIDINPPSKTTNTGMYGNKIKSAPTSRVTINCTKDAQYNGLVMNAGVPNKRNNTWFAYWSSDRTEVKTNYSIIWNDETKLYECERYVV